MKIIERQNWDSDLFGYEVGKIDFDLIENLDYKRFFEEAQDYKLVYVFSKRKIKNSYFKLVDEKVILTLSIKDTTVDDNAFKNKLELFKIGVDNIIELKELALKSGVFSRFYLDKNFTHNEYNKLYSLWIEKSIKGEISFNTILVKDIDILGFITVGKISKELSNIGLLSVLEEARGQGIGKALILEAILRSKLKGFSEIQVVTQKCNGPAMHLYKALNFKIKEIINIYHYWNV